MAIVSDLKAKCQATKRKLQASLVDVSVRGKKMVNAQTACNKSRGLLRSKKLQLKSRARAFRVAQELFQKRGQNSGAMLRAKQQVASSRRGLSQARTESIEASKQLRAMLFHRNMCRRSKQLAMALRDRLQMCLKVDYFKLRQQRSAMAMAARQGKLLKALKARHIAARRELIMRQSTEVLWRQAKFGKRRKALANRHSAERQHLDERFGDKLQKLKRRAARESRTESAKRACRAKAYAKVVRYGLHADKFMQDAPKCWGNPEPNLSGRHSFLLPIGDRHECTLIYLHQFCCNGASYVHFKPHYFFSTSKLPELRMKVALPTARAIPVTVHGGMKQYAWYDYKTDFEGEREDQLCMLSLHATRARLFQMLDREIAQLNGDASKVLIGGSSQGCCTALDVALTYRRLLGGVVGTSGHLLSCSPLPARKKHLPIYLYNGLADKTMRWKWVRATFSRFRTAGYTNVHIRAEEGVGHERPAGKEREWIIHFLSECLQK